MPHRVRLADPDDAAVIGQVLADQPDLVARRLYESLGFTNRAGGAGSPLMHVYERGLGGAEPGSAG
jgi:hypothetical protein